MTKVAIIPVPSENGTIVYNAVSGEKQTSGKTAGEALDAITTQLADDEGNTLIIVQRGHPDRFFGVAQQKRLQELMDRWRTARDNNDSLAKPEQLELEKLVEMELQASKDRATALMNELGT